MPSLPQELNNWVRGTPSFTDGANRLRKTHSIFPESLFLGCLLLPLVLLFYRREGGITAVQPAGIAFSAVPPG